MIPGPTPVPEKVLQALSKHPIGHRSKEFQDLVESTTKNLKWLHQTENDVLTITGSGTAAMEAGIINTLSRGDKVICGENGKFGERWVKVAKEFGLEVIKITSEWGTPLDPEKFKKVLEEDTQKEIKAVILTHSETSTGVINDLKTISSYIRAHNTALSIVDCVTSLGACNVPVDEWELDIVASGSQKGYMIPPGLSFIAISQKAWEAAEKSNLPKFYLNLKSYKKSLSSNSNPYTPAVNLVFALDEALKMMREEGLENIFSKKKIDSTILEEFEELIISSDAGVDVAKELRKDFESLKVDKKLDDHKEILKLLADKLAINLQKYEKDLSLMGNAKSAVIVVSGVNGVGKTTSIGKLGKYFKDNNRSVVFGAADTFRAAAIDQLQVWAAKVKVDIIKSEINSDPASVAFKTAEFAKKMKLMLH